MGKLKYVLLLVVVVVAYFASILATKDLHNRYVQATLQRIQAGSDDISITEHDIDSSLFGIQKAYTVSLFNDAINFSLYVRTSFSPFYEKNEVTVREFSGSLFTCDQCSFKELNANGIWSVNYFVNKYDGEIQMPSFTTGTKDNSLKISGFTSDFHGSFSDNKVHVGAKLDLIEANNELLATSTIIKRIVGDLNIQFDQGVTLAATKTITPSGANNSDKSFISLGQYYFNNRKTGVKVEAVNTNLSFDSTVSADDPNKVDIQQFIQAKSFKYENPELSSDLNLVRADININVKNATQHYWVEFARIVNNFIQMGRGVASGFDYEVMKNLQTNKTIINIDRLQMVSDVSRGNFKIKKGSYIAFDPTKNSNVKSALDLSIDFSLDSNFIKDFPEGDRLKQQFVSHDWLLHGALDSKDEYSTKLTIRSGKCSLGEDMLSGC